MSERRGKNREGEERRKREKRRQIVLSNTHDAAVLFVIPRAQF